MFFTDIFIKRPVLATVVSLLIFVLGLRSVGALSVRQYPFIETAVVTVTTTYVGADPEVIAGFITTPLENSIAQANGIDYMTSKSQLSQSIIQANLRLNYDSNRALNEINTKVNAVLNQLPKSSQAPVITVAVGETLDAMYIGFYSNELPRNKVTDYILREVQPKLQAVPGVQLAEILGPRQIALRAWLDPDRLAAFNTTANEVANALAANDFIAAAGRTDGDMIAINLSVDTNLTSVEEFKNLIIKQQNGAIIRLRDVANVMLGSQNYDTSVGFDGIDAVYIGIKVAPNANVLTVVKDVSQAFIKVNEQLPQGLRAKIVYDSTVFISSSINEVIHSLFEAVLIVTAVIFLFLGSLRAVFVPTVTIPLSLIGTFFMMLLFGYSINLLTLLALVLAIGLVVDDAIIVVENVYRHMEEGLSPWDATIISARELANPIIAISLVLIAVYLPIGFMEGLTGALFTEFAFTLAGSVAISAILALTLSPMMCSKLLKAEQKGKFIAYVDKKFETLQYKYIHSLTDSLNYLPMFLVLGIVVFIAMYFLYVGSKAELSPMEDQGFVVSQMTMEPNASLRQTEKYAKEFFDIVSKLPETLHVFQLNGVSGLNSATGGTVFTPWDNRHKTADQLQPLITQKLTQISGAKIATFQVSPLPGAGSGLPIQFVINTTESFDRINQVVEEFMKSAYASGMFVYLDSDLKIDKAQTRIKINRDKTAELGLTMQDVGNVLSAALSQNYINYFDLVGRSYQVIPQMKRERRLNAEQLRNYYIKNLSGTIIPLSTIVSLETIVVPESLNHFQQLNSATISAVAAHGVTVGDALSKFTEIAKQVLPEGFNIDYGGAARQYEQESSKLVVTFLFAIIIIFLCLAALFESFRDPVIVLISVPMSVFGALIFINLGFGGASLNIYTEVGLVTLIGLISKHGILIVQFANDLQKEGKNKLDAIIGAANIRLRPILMTTASMVLGVIPLITASGAGAASRYNIGLVIATGLSIGTFFTLYMVPALYLALADDLSESVEPQGL
jgi:multidrug efflux pump